jgi:hypothetical protein
MGKSIPNSKEIISTMLILISICFPGTGYADTVIQRRILEGLDLFPSFLAADRDIEQKRTSDGDLLLFLVSSEPENIIEFMHRYLFTNAPQRK